MKSKLLSLLAGLSFVGSLCLAPSEAEAVLASVKTLGMAATAIAYPTDSLVIAYNPAGITSVGDRLDTEGGWSRDTARLKIHGNAAPVGVNGSYKAMRTDNFYIGGFGITKSFCCECFEWSVGLAVYNRNFQKTTYNKALALFGTSHAGLEFLNETVAPTLAIRFWENHSLGISFNWQIERLKVNGLQNFAGTVPFASSIHPSEVTNRGYSWANGFNPTIGYRWEIRPELAIGATYQPKAKMSKFHKYRGFLSGGRIDVPEKWGMGVMWKPICGLIVCFDSELVRWSKIHALHNDLTLPNPLDPSTLLGAKHGAGFGFKDQWYYRVGAEWVPLENWAFRIGYRFAKALPRRSQTAVNALTQDCVESFITVGSTWYIDCANELSIAYAYGFEKKIKGKNSIPAALGGGEADLKERKYFLGLAWGRSW